MDVANIKKGTIEAIDSKIQKLRKLTNEFIFIEYYSHEDSDCYKIKNEFTKYGDNTIVLCKVSDGISRAIDNAIKIIGHNRNKKKTKLYLGNYGYKTTVPPIELDTDIVKWIDDRLRRLIIIDNRLEWARQRIEQVVSILKSHNEKYAADEIMTICNSFRSI